MMMTNATIATTFRSIALLHTITFLLVVVVVFISIINNNIIILSDGFTLYSFPFVQQQHQLKHQLTVKHQQHQQSRSKSSLLGVLSSSSSNDSNDDVSSTTTQPQQQLQQQQKPTGRRWMIQKVIMTTTAAAVLASIDINKNIAYADVSDGNTLPTGAQQFARTVQLKTNLKDVTKRLQTVTDINPIDKKEWDNISKFLRTVYSIAENDMKPIAKGLSYNPSNQKQAYNDIEEMKKYSQAGDISASQQDTSRLVSILLKLSDVLDDFFASLSDVPDEI